MSILYTNLGSIFWVVFILTIWFHSDIVDTIGKLTKLFNIDFVWCWLKLNEYTEYKVNTDVMASYPDFLYAEYPNPLTKLLSCNICFPFWLTIAHTFIIWPWQYALCVFPVNYCVSLAIYLLIRKLL